ncbi:MAG: hypothetical protein OQL19_07615 [Gammaproteobacteria bacterium]|nr:hypothetical protein [Gammaproteobacteria bacterium]
MSLIESFNIAKIKNIAIIDDDLRNTISLKDLRKHGGNELAVNALQDPDYEDYEKLIKLLKLHNKPHDSTNDIVNSLSDDVIRNNAPILFKQAAENVLSHRKDASAGVILIKQWLIESEVNCPIHEMSCREEINFDIDYDLILIDYYLKDESTDQSISLIEEFLEKNKDNTSPLLFLLMSSHHQELKDQFLRLRPKLRATSSRFRIMGKPRHDNKKDLLSWMCTFEQLANERDLIDPIEGFIDSWGKKLKNSVNNLSDDLWGLDAHSLNILYKTAKEDHAYFEEYMAELFSKHILALVEKDEFPIGETKNLETALFKIPSLKQGTEISDSRIVLRQLLGDVEWHREKWYEANESYPLPSVDTTDDKSDTENNIHLQDEGQYEWFMKYIRFGTVLRNSKAPNNILVNLTQPCDKAHIVYNNYEAHHLLLFPGDLGFIDDKQRVDKQATTSNYFNGNSWANIHWFLTRPQTPTIKIFLKQLENYEISGQLRHDSAQLILNQFASRSSRIGAMRTPLFSNLHGNILVKKEGNNVGWFYDESNLINGHLYTPNKGAKIISFEPSQVIKISNAMGDLDDDSELLSKLLTNQINNKLEITEYELILQIINIKPNFDKASIEDEAIIVQLTNIVKGSGQKILCLWRND